MTERNLKWMLHTIDRMLDFEIGDSAKLQSIKSGLIDSKTISEDDDNYFFQKLKDLDKVESVSLPSSSEKVHLPVGKIIGLSVLMLVIVGGVYVWMTEISPEIQRINENNQRIEEQNRQVIKDRGFGNYDCTYNEISKVNNCILR